MLNQKQPSNSHLLSILDKRAQSMTNIKHNWPGKLAPNFVLSVSHKQTNNAQSVTCK